MAKKMGASPRLLFSKPGLTNHDVIFYTIIDQINMEGYLGEIYVTYVSMTF